MRQVAYISVQPIPKDYTDEVIEVTEFENEAGLLV